jgi:predicted glutamine amidotransferase
VCRILAVLAARPVDARPLLASFAERCHLSREFQGDGWGVAWRQAGSWRVSRTVRPIWEAEPPELPPSTLTLVHARSAFRNEGVVVENNMPFVEGGLAFAFNGELRGVRLTAPGATGAWRLFHLLRRFHDADGATSDTRGLDALRRLDRVVVRRSAYVRALNVVSSDGTHVWLNTRFSEDEGYFTVHRATTTLDGARVEVASSETFQLAGSAPLRWEGVANGTTLTLGAAPPC